METVFRSKRYINDLEAGIGDVTELSVQRAIMSSNNGFISGEVKLALTLRRWKVPERKTLLFDVLLHIGNGSLNILRRTESPSIYSILENNLSKSSSKIDLRWAH
eukprot:scaffold3755_cov52-Cylindrotheca_fusiformis.AAC.2